MSELVSVRRSGRMETLLGHRAVRQLLGILSAAQTDMKTARLQGGRASGSGDDWRVGASCLTYMQIDLPQRLSTQASLFIIFNDTHALHFLSDPDRMQLFYVRDMRRG